MKNFTILGFILMSFFIKAQETQKVSVEKKLFGVQLGLINASFQYETKLGRKVTLLTEAGLEMISATYDFEDPAIKDKNATLFSPYLTIEPRWYYSLDRRAKLGKKTYNNSSNYISLATSYISNKTPLTNTGDFDVVSALAIIPKYGIHRAFAKHFYYEFSAGVGYLYNIFNNTEGCNCEHNNTTLDIQARIGYNF